MNKEAAAKVLSQTSDLLAEFGKTYWIDSGTLLSAFRDKDINEYDHDIDIRTIGTQWEVGEVAELIRRLWLMGYCHLIDTGEAQEQILAYHIDGVLLDFKFCHYDEESVWYYCFDGKPTITVAHLFDRRFFETLGSIDLLGREYPCPAPVEEYIEAHYGPEWRLFKVRASEADETDLTWDYMKDPPAMLTEKGFEALKGYEMPMMTYRRDYG